MNKLVILLCVVVTIDGFGGSLPETPPTIVGPGTISTQLDEFGASFTPDGKTCFFSIKSPSTISSNIIVICESHLVNEKWSEPAIVSFSGVHKDFSPSVSPDGQNLFFISNRPIDNTTRKDLNIWMSHRTTDGWSEPVSVGEPVNTTGWELACSMSGDGTLYYSTTGTTGDPDIYSSKWVNGKFETPIHLGDAINSEYSESDPFISPDGTYLLFSSTGRPDALADAGASASYPRGDIYVSFHNDGKWTPAKSVTAINTIADESSPSVSADGKKIYFTSEKNFVAIPLQQKLTYELLEMHLRGIINGLGNIYEVPASILNELK